MIQIFTRFLNISHLNIQKYIFIFLWSGSGSYLSTSSISSTLMVSLSPSLSKLVLLLRPQIPLKMIIDVSQSSETNEVESYHLSSVVSASKVKMSTCMYSAWILEESSLASQKQKWYEFSKGSRKEHHLEARDSLELPNAVLMFYTRHQITKFN